MRFYRLLFSFSKNNVDYAFKTCKKKSDINGFKLLQSTEDINLEYGKILIVTSKRVGNACERNRIRRRVKEVFYTKKLYVKKIISILLVYPKAKTLTFHEIESFLESNF